MHHSDRSMKLLSGLALLLSAFGFVHAQTVVVHNANVYTPQGDGVRNYAGFVLRNGKVERVALPTRVRVSGAESYVGAAFAGFGIIQAPRYRLDGYFGDGRLVPLLDAYPPLPSPVSIVYPKTRLPSPRLRAFIEWAQDALMD